ncbi:MOSC domain-containing protein [Frankia sp. Cr1]|uniref:MOSC domain-containing protein n=1 Tax=Frankia sp. Cr1 TaxID=3073931 RepID=UPI002AD3CE55|nr:MOSC domain-containing protein [Frankia sp. Cr1]
MADADATGTVRGRLVGIYVTPQRGAAMQSPGTVFAVEGKGLDGDRYAAGTGTFSGRAGPGRQVTLIEREAVAAAVADTGVQLAEHETRRNLVTAGVTLLDLVGRTFRIGDVVLCGVRSCLPCGYLDQRTRPGVRNALEHRGGLRADIVRGGTLTVGDEIVILPG